MKLSKQIKKMSFSIYSHPTLANFDGIKIIIIYGDRGRHKKPHIHAFYGDGEVVVDTDGKVIVGKIDKRKLKKVINFVKNNKEELEKLWLKAKDEISIEKKIKKIEWIIE